jgi:alkanesulfonate monooxygenase SsuD/methylene tetrahydromethanopterin reductase-like flavin-dependent oxidoreductase (luciferase family)
MFTMRFDMRAPGKTAAEIADLYQCAIEMAEWAETKGCASIIISEHHAADDGYLPSPYLLASSIAAVTKSVPIAVAAALLPMYDPVRMAEDIIVLDHISRGRVMHVFGIGYRPAEYDLYGLEFKNRGAIADAKLAKLLETLAAASSADTMPRVTPAPFTSPRPMISWGGGTKAAARRAGGNGLGFFAQTDTAGLEEAFRGAEKKGGHEPGMLILSSPSAPASIYVHPDPNVGWKEVGPYLLADAMAYAEWNENTGLNTASLSWSKTVEDLRAEGGAHRVATIDEAVGYIKKYGALSLHPLCGGCPPEVAWPYLRRVVEEVLPALASS